MLVRHKFEPIIVAGAVLMMALAANAAGTGGISTPGTAGDGSIGDVTRPVGNLSNCVDLKGDCNTLMVNYYSDSVEFALFQRGKFGGSSAEKPVDKQRVSRGQHSNGNQLATADGQERALSIDFLHGLQEKGDAPAVATHISGAGQDAPALEGLHNWASAAAKSLDQQHKQDVDNNSRVVASGLGRDLTTFWDFEHVYQWQVDVNILDDGASDLSQLVLSNIYLSARTNSRSDPRTVVCAFTDPDNC